CGGERDRADDIRDRRVADTERLVAATVAELRRCRVRLAHGSLLSDCRGGCYANSKQPNDGACRRISGRSTNRCDTEMTEARTNGRRQEASSEDAGLFGARWRRLVPVVFVTYSLAYLDRSNYSLGAAGGLTKSLHIS